MAHKIHEGTSLRAEQPAVTPLSFGERMWVEGPMWGLPALVFCVMGAVLGHSIDAMFGGAVAGVILWTSALVAIGIRINGEQDFVVIERLGRLLRVQPRGIYILWLPGLIDKIKCRDTFMAKEVPLYVGEHNLIDFTDGSTRVISSAWYHIANPVDIANKDWKKVTVQVSRWVYAVDNSEGRLVSVLEGNFRPLLQAHSVDSAQLSCESCAEQAVEESREALEHIGAYPRPEQAIVIQDILIPDDIQSLRELRLKGEAKAQEAKNMASGYAASVAAIVEGAKASDHDMPWEEAQALYERQRGLETIERTGANITFVSPDISGVLVTVGVGTKAGA